MEPRSYTVYIKGSRVIKSVALHNLAIPCRYFRLCIKKNYLTQNMGKVNKKQKKIDKFAEEKARLAKREQMLSEIRHHSIDKKTQNKLKSVVTSNQKARKPKDGPKPL